MFSQKHIWIEKRQTLPLQHSFLVLLKSFLLNHYTVFRTLLKQNANLFVSHWTHITKTHDPVLRQHQNILWSDVMVRCRTSILSCSIPCHCDLFILWTTETQVKSKLINQKLTLSFCLETTYLCLQYEEFFSSLFQSIFSPSHKTTYYSCNRPKIRHKAPTSHLLSLL